MDLLASMAGLSRLDAWPMCWAFGSGCYEAHVQTFSRRVSSIVVVPLTRLRA